MNVVCGPRLQLVQSVGNTPRSVLHRHNPVLCTWTLRYIAHLFMVGGTRKEVHVRNAEERRRRDGRGKIWGRGKKNICASFSYHCCYPKVHSMTDFDPEIYCNLMWLTLYWVMAPLGLLGGSHLKLTESWKTLTTRRFSGGPGALLYVRENVERSRCDMHT